MKNILIPTDFSDNAWNAISYAMEFFKNEKCKFYFLHTYIPAFYRMDYAMGGPAFSAIPDMEVDVAVAGLEKTLEDVKEQFPNPKHTFEIVSAFNTLTDEINELSEKRKIDMVVMGTQGAAGVKQLFLGTSTVFVIRKAKVPVLVIPESCKFKPVKNILFPSDYLTPYKKEEIYTIIEAAKMHGAKITVLHINEEHNLPNAQIENKELVLKHLRNTSTTEVEVVGKTMPGAILEYIGEHQIDLLAMMNHSHSFFERILIKQNIEQIGFHIHIPFLVVRDTAEI
ncbi:universal stress protein [uncultured Muriicola sp.]|uniref:universal stress protein n=1 Tax=uncultured Muriicola sp. TaxID=1583102 RepID=UPI002602BF3B|nr:universal stress protein [uncultured Muriicola sp.]